MTSIASAKEQGFSIGKIPFTEILLTFDVPTSTRTASACGEPDYDLGRENPVVGLINDSLATTFEETDWMVSDGMNHQPSPNELFGRNISNILVEFQ